MDKNAEKEILSILDAQAQMIGQLMQRVEAIYRDFGTVQCQTSAMLLGLQQQCSQIQTALSSLQYQ